MCQEKKARGYPFLDVLMKKPPYACKILFVETVNSSKTRRFKYVTKRFHPLQDKKFTK